MSYIANRLINPSTDLPYQLMDGGGLLGLAKATGTFQFPSVLGFKMGPLCRIENCTITIPSASYSASFGISTNWGLVGYFTTHDLNITTQGIGRSGSGNLGGGWQNDVCGFYLNISSSIILNAGSVIIEYDFFSNSGMKHGVGFFQSTSQPTGSDGGLDLNYLGTWDNATYIRLPTSLSAITYIPRQSFASGTRYSRKITIINKLA